MLPLHAPPKTGYVEMLKSIPEGDGWSTKMWRLRIQIGG